MIPPLQTNQLRMFVDATISEERSSPKTRALKTTRQRQLPSQSTSLSANISRLGENDFAA